MSRHCEASVNSPNSMTRLSHTLTIPATTRTTTMACEGGDVDDDVVESMSHSARSLQYIGTDIGQSSHLPHTTEPYTNHNTTYNDNNNNTTIATPTRTTALTCVLVMVILTLTLTKTFSPLRTTLKPTSLTRELATTGIYCIVRLHRPPPRRFRS